MNNFTIIILGVTGDLAKRKLLPALCALIDRQEFSGVIIGTGREDTTADAILQKAQSFIKHGDIKKLASVFSYQRLDFATSGDFKVLADHVQQSEQNRGIKNGKRLVYLATAAHFFCEITENIVKMGIVVSRNDNHFVVYEKPFGWDTTSAKMINECIKNVLSESQVYRIDHYLAKEFVSNIVLLRYSNTLFKTIWENHTIESVKILFAETIGLEGRGALYDRYGVIRDVVQNHVLQILALVAMDAPPSLDPNALRDKKAEVFRAVRVVDGILGQFEGYQSEPGVDPQSRTETYAAIKLFIDVPAWKGVPFYLEAGKELNRKTTEIQITLKPVSYCLWSEKGGTCESNIITIHITPEEGFSLRVNTKKPGTLNDIMTVALNFVDRSIFSPTSSEAYEIIFKEIMAGNKALSVRFDEIEYQWDIADTIIAKNLPLYTYKKKSAGPPQAAPLFNERIL
jgi:glucose-6-phosphate 1-dehydrogenase